MPFTHTLAGRLDVLSTISQSIREGVLDVVLSPFWDGRIPEGDTRSPDLKAATTDLLAAAARLEAVAQKDLEQLKLKGRQA